MQLVGICSNDPTDYPDDAPARLLARWREKGFGFPYGVDASQDVARAFGAVCTPEFFVYGPDRRLAYHGRLDDSWREPAQGDAARAGGRVRRAARRARSRRASRSRRWGARSSGAGPRDARSRTLRSAAASAAWCTTLSGTPARQRQRAAVLVLRRDVQRPVGRARHLDAHRALRRLDAPLLARQDHAPRRSSSAARSSTSRRTRSPPAGRGRRDRASTRSVTPGRLFFITTGSRNASRAPAASSRSSTCS